MKFYKTNYYNRANYTYKSVTGEIITLVPGNAGGEITAELIEYLHKLDDKEVNNNIKNHKPQLTNEEKKANREWEESHPGEKVPKNWTISFDAFSEDSDSDMDCSDLMREVYDRLHAENSDIDHLWEVINDMPFKQRQALVLVELDGYTMTETADRLGCSIANVSKLVARAKEFIKNNF